jgi:hypothetical protein
MVQCTPWRERAASPPPRESHGECAYYRGCPKQEWGAPIQPCAPELEIIGARELRAEGGHRQVGSPIAVRGLAFLVTPVVVGRKIDTSGAVAVDSVCGFRKTRFTLAADESFPCQCVHLTLPDSLVCVGDTTDHCCHANPALPAHGALVVAVGTYLGPARIEPVGGQGDDVAVEYFCTLPAGRATRGHR